MQAIHVYELLSTTCTIQYLYAAASFPTNVTWIKAIKTGNFIWWPGLPVAAIIWQFPESDKAQKGNMKQQWQTVHY